MHVLLRSVFSLLCHFDKLDVGKKSRVVFIICRYIMHKCACLGDCHLVF